MPFDGIFMAGALAEIRELVNAKVEKVQQPSADTLVLTLGSRAASGRVLICANPVAPRLHITRRARENPAAPPMFCMLLRKNLVGARLVGVTQAGLDRAAVLDFEAYNDMSDLVSRKLHVEMMGRHSNVILTENGRITDALKRVDFSMSATRQLLPGFAFVPPEPQDKLEPAAVDAPALDRALNAGGRLDKTLTALVAGLSPMCAREIAFRAGIDADADAAALDGAARARLLSRIADHAAATPSPLLLFRDGEAFDYTYMPVAQYGCAVELRPAASFGEALDEFYAAADLARVRHDRGADVRRCISSNIERLSRKLNLQRADAAECEKRGQWRLYGESIMANIYAIKPGDDRLDCEDFYNGGRLEIPLDPDLSGARNAQKYYKMYRKAATAAAHLEVETAKTAQALEYLAGVSDAFSRARTAAEIEEIRAELAGAGYIRVSAKKKKTAAPTAWHVFAAPDGTQVLAGKNNVQNEHLTTRLAARQDMWLHVRDMPGSHVIVRCAPDEPSDETLLFAAEIAAALSGAADSANVPVDATRVCYVKKIPGAPPGLVTYTNQRTVTVTPHGLPSAAAGRG